MTTPIPPSSPSFTPPSSLSPASEHIRNIAFDLVVAIITCWIFNIYVQHRQMKALNAMLKQEKYSFWSWFLLTLITCGLYHIYHEYRKMSDLVVVTKTPGDSEPVICIVLSIFGLAIVADAIMQSHINRHYGSTAL